MQFFKNVNVDWIAKKNIFIGLTLALFFASIISLVVKGGPRYGIDFSGGTLIYVKFKEKPQLDAIRAALKQRGLGESTIQSFGAEDEHEVIISLDQKVTAGGSQLDQGQSKIDETLNLSFRPPDAQADKLDLNNIGISRLESVLGTFGNVSSALQKSSEKGPRTVTELARILI